MASFATILHLKHLAEQAMLNAVRLNASLPMPFAVSMRLDGDIFLKGTSIHTSQTIAAPAVYRILLKYLQKRPRLFRITDVYFLTAEENGVWPLEELLALQGFATPRTKIYWADGERVTTKRLHDLLPLLPAPLRDIDPPQHPYLLGVSGHGTNRRTTLEEAFSNSLHAVPLSSEADPTMLTPMRALLADLHETYNQFEIEKLEIWMEQDIPSANMAMPISGRDLQALARETPPSMSVLYYPCFEAAPITMTLHDLMPGAYISSKAKYHTIHDYHWQEADAKLLNVMLGQAGITEHLEKAALAALLKTDPKHGAPRAMAAISTKGEMIAAHNLPIQPHGIPSCAETIGLRLGMAHFPGLKIKAMLQIITDDHHHPILGNHAAPCGFCRESILQCADDETLIILSNTKGQYQYAHASSLLPFSKHALGWVPEGGMPLHHTNDSFMLPLAADKGMNPKHLHRLALQVMSWSRRKTALVAYSRASELVYTVTAASSAYADCHWPPLLPQLLSNTMDKADMYLYCTHLPDQGMGAFLRYGLLYSARSKQTPLYFCQGNQDYSVHAVGALCSSLPERVEISKVVKNSTEVP
jgi:cytidine deaminase